MRFLIFLTFCCAACSTGDDRAVSEQTRIVVEEQHLAATLKDPASAQFRNVHVYYAVRPVVCGEVNSRNGYGGRSGYQRFVSTGPIQVLEEQMAPTEMNKTWEALCH